MSRFFNPRLAPARQQGLTLIELMVAMVLSLVLMLGAMQLFVGSKQTYQLSEGLARVQENGRFALDLLAREVRQAGYTGCFARPEFTNLIDDDNSAATDPPWWQYNFVQPIFGYEGSDADVDFPAELTAGPSDAPAWTAEAEPDALVVLFGDARQNFAVTGPASPSPDAALEIDSTIEWDAGQALLATDCERATSFRLTTAKTASDSLLKHAASGLPSQNNCSASLPYSCGSGVAPIMIRPYVKDVSRVVALQARGYYVANTNRLDADGNPVPALYRQRLTASGLTREELVEGVADMQVTYGVAPENNRSAEKFLPKDDVDDDEWPQVVALRIELTMRSVIDPLLEQTFAATIALRNRTL